MPFFVDILRHDYRIARILTQPDSVPVARRTRMAICPNAPSRGPRTGRRFRRPPARAEEERIVRERPRRLGRPALRSMKKPSIRDRGCMCLSIGFAGLQATTSARQCSQCPPGHHAGGGSQRHGYRTIARRRLVQCDGRVDAESGGHRVPLGEKIDRSRTSGRRSSLGPRRQYPGSRMHSTLRGHRPDRLPACHC